LIIPNQSNKMLTVRIEGNQSNGGIVFSAGALYLNDYEPVWRCPLCETWYPEIVTHCDLCDWDRPVKPGPKETK
jgi:hypothetical protein